MTSRIKFKLKGQDAPDHLQATSAIQGLPSKNLSRDVQRPTQKPVSDDGTAAIDTRSRLRLPIRHDTTKQRDRSREKLSAKLQKLSLYTSQSSTINDVPHGNSSLQSEALLPENEREQNARGRSSVRGSPRVEGDADPEMLSLMGFASFDSTKGKVVSGNKGGSARCEKATEYRQYMNRQKGFNRPLLPKRG